MLATLKEIMFILMYMTGIIFFGCLFLVVVDAIYDVIVERVRWGRRK